ncbi:DEAD/DEAH box helicase domain-containing protein [Halococcus morrhuae DSM 1307]|uniref:DEAD/DEAH box helicase domain-containing protein n=1 Tax=Halococcus morrhuae DSM 1307 TaxID=931277 RepID=M0MSH4_HALMO|nr:DEAD/DEAH box helicase [Halococcus morrhuae]EMA48313.1 DEAD/DEAH box helicase domain-containing protein [Halococcus morrhuae DSM 1307]
MNVAEAVPEFADAFAFEEFNRMQREALPAIMNRDENVVASAPTASGKTALAELAICKCLAADGTSLFIAPLRALTNEKESEWERFEDLGYSVYVVTGERDLNPRRAERADILVMTPEKVDSATRKHDSPRYEFITDVGCCVIDEVHLLDSENRGSVLEVTISRLRRLAAPRVVALSATMPNVNEVADWLDAVPETTFDFGQEYRPVDLESGVRTYTHGENAFADKYRRLYRALDLAEEHIREDGQALVFVASRQDTVRAAEKARDELASRDVPMGARGDYDFHTETQVLENQTLRKSALDGVAFHHAGLSKSDKDHVEQWFREGKIQLLFSTSTLAWGVNLPARCVVIRDTKYHDPLEGEVDMSPLDVLQMLGRAGRPGYDDAGYAYVVCDGSDAEKYRKLLRDGTEINSHLTADLDTHLNAEIAMGTIDDVPDVMEWLETTFAFVRARSADEGAVAALRERVREALSTLDDRGFVAIEGDTVSATPLGTLASAYYLRLPTAHRFHDLAGTDPTTSALLDAVARSAEFDSVNARRAERDAIESVLDGHGDLDPGRRKVLAILASSTRAATPSELQSDAWVIRQNAVRLLAALRAFLDRFGSEWEANRARRAAARVENGVGEESVALTAIDGVGPGRASKLAGEGIETPAAVVESGVEELVAVGLTEGVAERVVESAHDLPVLSIDWGSFPERIARGENELCEVTIENDGDGARAGIRVSVNDTEMTATSSFLGSETVPAPVFGGEPDTLKFTVEIVFPDLPLAPITETRTVWVD